MTEHWSSFLIYDWTMERLPSYMTRTFLQCVIQEKDFPYIWGCSLSLKFHNKENFSQFGSLTERLVFQARIQPLLQPVEDLVAVLYHRLLTANHCQCVSTNPAIFNQFQLVPTIPCQTQLNLTYSPASWGHGSCPLPQTPHCQTLPMRFNQSNYVQPVSTSSNHSVPEPAKTDIFSS